MTVNRHRVSFQGKRNILKLDVMIVAKFYISILKFIELYI